MGPPPATNPTPTSHCDRTAFSRLAKLMSQASAISLPFPVARPRIMAMLETTGCAGQAHQDVRPRLQSPLGLAADRSDPPALRENRVIEKETFNGAVKDHNLELFVRFERLGR